MKNDRRPFILAEIILGIAVLVLIVIMFQGRTDKKKVAVILNNSESGQWSGFIYGLKQAARDENLDLVITSTGRISDLEEEKALIQQEMADGADALIIEPAPGENTGSALQEIAGGVPVMLVKSSGLGGDLPSVTPDNYAMGQALGQMVLDAYAGGIEGKTIGIINHDRDTEAADDREEGLMSVLAGTGCEIIWSLHGLDEVSNPGEQIRSRKSADLVLALDTEDLETAGELARERNIHGAVIYGIGSSVQSIYYLDYGHIEGLVFPDFLDMGYQSGVQIAGRLQHAVLHMDDVTTSYRVLSQEDLFLEENRDIWYMLDR